MKRIFWIVLDSLGVGAAPDAAAFGDVGANTLASVSRSREFSVPNLLRLGLANLDGQRDLGPVDRPRAAVARLREQSMGKDTTIGHWELAGVISPKPLPTYPNGFPQELLDEFSRQTGRGVLCNRPYSGTDVIRDYGQQHLQTGKLIVYTSADSVFQIAAHEDVVPLEELYRCCRIARTLLTGENAVGRVIARPFTGSWPFVRTANRHDFSLMPPRTVLNAAMDAGLDVIGVGKIGDIFAGSGVTASYPTRSNADGMEKTLSLARQDFHGVCFVNLVEFDSLYGHRQDRDGYARALAEFDRWLPEFLDQLGPEDAVILTADHGCDPCDQSTDHTREYVPLLIWGPSIYPRNLGTRECFADVAATVRDLLGISYDTPGRSFAGALTMRPEELLAQAQAARERAYAPYSGFRVGAALLTTDGRVYTGCNIENAAYSPTNCAERTAVFKAVSEGERHFAAIAVAGGSKPCPPCGVCRQVLGEFCGPDFPVYLETQNGWEVLPLKELLPCGFSL